MPDFEKLSTPSPAEIAHARSALSCFVRSEAVCTREELGFGWRPSSSAPWGLAELIGEFRSCHVSGLPLRVARDFSKDAIYDRPSTNWAFRFLHDTRHVWLHADYSTEAELAVASCHLARAKAAGLVPGSLAYAFLMADTVGQTIYLARTHLSVVHQLAFALDCVRFDIDTAIALEKARCIATNMA